MDIFLLLTIGIVTATVFGFVARVFKQPPVVGYLFAGLILGVFEIYSGRNASDLASLGQLGVTLLLFLVGLEMNIKDLKNLGKIVLLGGMGQILFTGLIAFTVAQLLGFDSISSLYIALALSFSSTIVIVKILSEKKDLDSLYGKITIGFLLFQDIAAILALVILSGFHNSNFEATSLVFVLAKGVLLLTLVWFLSKFILTKIMDRVATLSQELLFLGSIAWMLGTASFVSLPIVGFTPEIGGLLAGIALASSSGHLQIASKIRPLRDFFITIFFLLLGTTMAVNINTESIFPSLVFSLLIIIIGPLVVLVLLGLLGHKRRTSFLVSVAFAQLSEFSLVLVAFGYKLGHIGSSVVGLISLVTVITIVVSTYLMINSQRLFEVLDSLLKVFEKKQAKESAFSINKKFSNHLILLGCHRLGERVLPILKKRAEDLVVVDFNPQVVEKLTADGISAFYGDATDAETLEQLNLEEARLVLSTTGSLEDNLFVLEKVAKSLRRPLTIFSATSASEALVLYEKGADFCLVPHIAGGDHLAHILGTHGLALDYFKKAKLRHFDRLAKERF